MEYIEPDRVRSPKKNWTLEDVLDAGEEGKTALAVGLWNGTKREDGLLAIGDRATRPWSFPVLAMRWNGLNEKGREKGDPQDRGWPTWFVIEEKYYEAILGSGILAPDKLARARRYLDPVLLRSSRPDRQTRREEPHALPRSQPDLKGHIEPKDVRSPKNWELIEVLDAGEEGKSALAIGRWKETRGGHPLPRPVLAMRWNGYDVPIEEDGETRFGYPQAGGGHPRWFVVDEKYYEAILRSGVLAPDKLAIARGFFPEK